MSSLEPVAHIDIVQVLLHNLVAADPQEAVPVALLEFQVAHPRVALPVGEELAVGEIQHRRPYPVGVHLHDVADLAVPISSCAAGIPGRSSSGRASGWGRTCCW